MSREKGHPMAVDEDKVDPRALMSLIEYVVVEAQQLSPVAAMLLALARRELVLHLAIYDGNVVRYER
jgi:hypothetical protein